MEKLFVFFVIALVANGAFGQGQAQQNEEDLEDRYGWNRPNWNQRPTFPGQNQNQFPGQFPGQNQNQFPGQFPGQNQNQFPGQFPGQNQNQNQFPGQFPGQNQNQFPGQFPGQNQNQNQFPGQFPGNWNQIPTASPNSAATTVPTPTGPTTTTQSPEIRACIASCPVTSEYNPVCGTDNNTYPNPGRLSCAQLCGVGVSLLRTSPCPTPPPAVPV